MRMKDNLQPIDEPGPPPKGLLSFDPNSELSVSLLLFLLFNICNIFAKPALFNMFTIIVTPGLHIVSDLVSSGYWANLVIAGI